MVYRPGTSRLSLALTGLPAAYSVVSGVPPLVRPRETLAAAFDHVQLRGSP